MTILYWPGKLHGNARIDTRPCPHVDCPDQGNLIKKVKGSSEKKARPLCAIQMRSQDDGHDSEIISDVVPSLSDEEIRVAQKQYPELCRFMEFLHEYKEKPNSK